MSKEQLSETTTSIFFPISLPLRDEWIVVNRERRCSLRLNVGIDIDSSISLKVELNQRLIVWE